MVRLQQEGARLNPATRRIPFVLAAALAVASAAAQNEPPRALSRVDFGWNTTITAGRWTPVRVWLDGSVGPVAGMVIVEYEQDRTQKAQVIVPASTTPGKLTPVDLAVCIPADVGTVTVTFDGGGRRPETMDFTPPPTAGTVATPRRGEQRLGQLFGGTRGLVVHAGIGSLERAFPAPREVDHSPAVGGRMIEGFNSATGAALAELKWMQLAVTDVATEELPTIGQAYEGLEALVLDAPRTAGMTAWQRSAIMKWVAGGGRLVLLATDDSGAWRQWLPEGERGEVLAAGAPARMAVPAGVAAGLAGETLTFETAAPDDESGGPRYLAHVGPGQDLKTKAEASAAVAMRGEIRARPFTVTASGAAAGWTAGWKTAGETGLFATGPVGMGLVTVLGVDPEGLPAALDASASKRLWRQVLEKPLGTYLSDPFQSGHPRDGEVSAALNTIVGVPALRDTVFNTVLGSLVGLALLMGPVDWFVLKRFRARQHSWLAALGWITVASAGAYVIPPLLRSGPPQVNRLTVTDVLQETNGPGRARAWQSGLTGVFASGPLSVQFDAEPGSPAAGSWWHGVAPQQNDYRSFVRSPDERRGLRTISAIATPQLSSREGERQNVPAPIRMPSWSYRTMADSSTPAAPGVRAAVTRTAEGGYEVALTGLAEGAGAGVGRATLYGAGGAVGAERVRFTSGGSALEVSGIVPERARAEAVWDRYGAWVSSPPAPGGFHWTGTIPGPSRREAAVQARLESGRWVMVELVLASPSAGARFMPEGVLARDGYQISGVSTLRILVPLEGGAEGKEATR